ncbi:MAG TPA: hypothetical protein VEJ46_16795 [Candidatus Acidoferrum sp.]|nr:hypothetical protein [Candidatus Acidoferrum sp.]
MNLEHLSDGDKAAVGQALRAAADGPFFDEWEFHTLFGLTRSEVRAVADAWPNVDLLSAKVQLAVNSAFNNLLGYPHRQDSVWSQWISVSRSQLDELFSRLRGRAGERYFERMS